jgi:hypothetical protein
VQPPLVKALLFHYSHDFSKIPPATTHYRQTVTVHQHAARNTRSGQHVALLGRFAGYTDDAQCTDLLDQLVYCTQRVHSRVFKTKLNFKILKL